MELNNQSSFGIGEGELIEIIYELPLPMRLDRWLVSKRPEQSRARIKHFINSGLVLVNYKTAKAKTPLKNGESKDPIKKWRQCPNMDASSRASYLFETRKNGFKYPF